MMRSLHKVPPRLLVLMLMFILLGSGAGVAAFLRGADPGPDGHAGDAAGSVAVHKQDFLLGILNRHARKLDVGSRLALADALLEAEREHAIDSLLLVAVIERESSFDPRARSRAGALGLMQLRPFTARELAAARGWSWNGPDQLYEPVFNVRLGSAYLGEMLRRFDDTTVALAAYNVGPTRVQRQLAVGRKPSHRYARRVLSKHRSLLESFERSGGRETSIAG